MKKPLTLSCLVFSFFAIHAQTSDSLSGPRVWFSADRSQLTAGKLTDLSFFKNDAVGESTGSTPSSYDSINYNKAIVFDGIDDYLKIPYSLEGLAEVSILAVFQSSDTTERGIWGTEQSLSRNVLMTTRTAVGPDTVADLYGKNENVIIQNTLIQNWDKTSILSNDAFIALGSAGKTKNYKAFQGALAELIIFNKALSFLERVQYETYLAIKYGTGLNGGNFVSSEEKLLWHVEQNQIYGKNIAGIGRDDFFQLNQKQSGSAYDSGLLVVSAGDLAATNPQNNAVVNNQDFILWGDNGLPLKTKPGTGADSVLSVLERKWLLTVNGNTASGIPSNIYIDADRLPSNPLGYWLIIDRSGQGNFSVDNLEYIFPDAMVDGKVVYRNVLWDTDGSGKDNFTFARALSLFAILKKIADPSCTDENAGEVAMNVIAGQAPFQYKLTNSDGSMSRQWKDTESVTEMNNLIPGEYIITLEDASEETVIRKFALTMPDALNISLGSDQKFSAANPIVLDVSNQVPDSVDVTYRWENSFGFSSSDEKITASETGVYRVFVTKEKDGCVFTDEVSITGAETQRVAVYPTILNDNDIYNVSISLQEQGSVAIKVYNSSGVIVDSMEGFNNSEYQFVTKMKERGLFLVVIQTSTKIETQKIIVY